MLLLLFRVRVAGELAPQLLLNLGHKAIESFLSNARTPVEAGYYVTSRV
jgi:hypothetical protein